jgi:hypothetical protein
LFHRAKSKIFAAQNSCQIEICTRIKIRISRHLFATENHHIISTSSAQNYLRPSPNSKEMSDSESEAASGSDEEESGSGGSDGSDESGGSGSGSDAGSASEKSGSESGAPSSPEKKGPVIPKGREVDTLRFVLGGKPVVLSVFADGSLKVHLDKRKKSKSKAKKEPVPPSGPIEIATQTGDEDVEAPKPKPPQLQKKIEFRSGKHQISIVCDSERIHVRIAPPAKPTPAPPVALPEYVISCLRYGRLTRSW